MQEPEVDSGAFLGIAVSRYNQSITSRLLDGALDTLGAAGVDPATLRIAHVPGAWELPLMAQRLARVKGIRAVICLGAVIQGETTHDRYINQQVSQSLGQIALDLDLPVLFGLLTCQSIEQALNRAGGTAGNKGAECAQAALEMIQALDSIG